MRGWIDYTGAAVLVVLAVFSRMVDAGFAAGILVLVAPPMVAGLVWVGVALRRRPCPDQVPVKAS